MGEVCICGATTAARGEAEACPVHPKAATASVPRRRTPLLLSALIWLTVAGAGAALAILGVLRGDGWSLASGFALLFLVAITATQ